MVIIRLIGGLCNRLRCLISCMKSKNFDKILFTWPVETYALPIHFNDIFKNKINFVPDSYDLGYKKTIADASNTYIKYTESLNLDLSSSNILTFSDELEIYDYKILSNQLILKDEILQNINDEYKNKFTNNVYGIHVRRGCGHNYHYVSSFISPVELFAKKMRELLYIDDSITFFVSSDDYHNIWYLSYYFGDKVIFTSEIYGPLDSGYTPLGTIRSVIDLYLLSKTKRLFCSPGSSYGQFACWLGGLKYEYLADYKNMRFVDYIEEKGKLLK